MKRDFQVLSGLDHTKANANGDGAGDHARAIATFFNRMPSVAKLPAKTLRSGFRSIKSQPNQSERKRNYLLWS